MADFPAAQLLDVLGMQGRDLVARENGRRALPLLEKSLLGLPIGAALAVDFGNIGVADASFSDAAFVELGVRLREGAYGDRFVVLANVGQDLGENIEGAIARRKARVTFLTRNGGRMGLLGPVEANLRETWELALREGELTARRLADLLGLEINTASTRLLKLHAARLLARREEVSAAGRQHIYRLPG